MKKFPSCILELLRLRRFVWTDERAERQVDGQTDRRHKKRRHKNTLNRLKGPKAFAIYLAMFPGYDS